MRKFLQKYITEENILDGVEILTITLIALLLIYMLMEQITSLRSLSELGKPEAAIVTPAGGGNRKNWDYLSIDVNYIK